ncbi:hypothetical protein TNCV_2415081 [Trichonephila clavipes]|nr:hypothetical protein TNCV_2415081 [Trichonephila clavipes]
MGALSSRKIPCPAGNKVCIIGWTWSAEIFLYFSPVIHPFRVTIDPAKNHNMTVHIMTDPFPCLTVGMRQSRSYACTDVLQMCTRHVVGKRGKDDSSDYTFFNLSIDQVFLGVTPL